MKAKSNIMDIKVAHLLNLIKQNPLLPILPMVNQEVVSDDCWCYWLGKWGDANIDRYFVHNRRIFLKDNEDPFDVLERIGYPQNVDDMTDEERDDILKYNIGHNHLKELDKIKTFFEINNFRPLKYD